MPAVVWDSPVQFLKGVGPVRARALDRLGIATVGDLLRHYPRAYLDRTAVTPIRTARPGDEVTVQGQVLTAGERRTRRKRTLQTVTVDDGTDVLFCQWFGQSYLLRQFRSGTRVLLSGKVQLHAGRKQLVHPDFELLGGEEARLHTGRLVPVYPLTGGIGQHWLRRLIHETLNAALPAAEETLPQDLRRSRGLCSLGAALSGIHFPAGADELDRARKRMVYEEIFFIQLAMGLRRRDREAQAGRRLGAPGDLTTRLVAGLPFALTAAQRRVLREILRDMRSGHVMHRLLQGDVGCGKTLVALIAALFVIEQGHQALLMAPTEVLARQHGETIGGYCEVLGVAVATLTGGTPARERRRILDAVHAGEIDLLIGTHALVQDGVSIPRLGLAVVDEQHRFGVQQRGRVTLVARDGTPPHMLVMSATPIPRSLSLTLYGDLDLSIIDELPAGRRPIATALVTADELAEKHEFIRDQLRRGRQAY
ncbi:ATP-dependent DNA helicase RecG, partial [bacterium]|nr:ATP-dependent DNA helicase RecG [bacterium]